MLFGRDFLPASAKVRVKRREDGRERHPKNLAEQHDPVFSDTAEASVALKIAKKVFNDDLAFMAISAIRISPIVIKIATIGVRLLAGYDGKAGNFVGGQTAEQLSEGEEPLSQVCGVVTAAPTITHLNSEGVKTVELEQRH